MEEEEEEEEDFNLTNFPASPPVPVEGEEVPAAVGQRLPAPGPDAVRAAVQRLHPRGQDQGRTRPRALVSGEKKN